ncbi:cytochrome P450 [Amycolatopsis pithecellobii]|uniref:Cytochrome P450 n=1 Tax=Amycolatopsis pithecellobii TaxID=664692 RepID=A0A6N7ZCX7_9PSEU|nr:cytochrome P450 [Amycolatopsis pithecellobii]MTD59622.1 cytochrome P450 [Amycolatopsis pithecellobii]
MSLVTGPIPLPLPRERECPFGPAPEVDALRRRSPVVKVTCPTGIEAWLVTRYDDVRQVLSDSQRFSSRTGALGHMVFTMPPDAPVEEGNLNRMDGADHLRFRRVIAPAITTVKRTELFRPQIQRIVDELLDELATETGPVDLHEKFSLPLGATVIAELLDIPREDRVLFLQLAKTLLARDAGAEELEAAQAPLFQYLYGLVTRRSQDPGDDVISVIAAKARNAEGAFSDLELMTIVSGLLVGGYDTTASLITYGTLALLENPDQFAALRRSPELAPSAVEELVRLVGSGAGMLRVATVDTEIAGSPIAAGDYVVVAVQSANHDPERFPKADRLDIARPRSPHVGFGHGPHQCPGQQVVRLELSAVLTTLPQRIPSLRLAVPFEEIPFKENHAVLGPAKLPVTWDEVLGADRVTVGSRDRLENPPDLLPDGDGVAER